MPVFHREKALQLAKRFLWLAGSDLSAFRLLLLLYLAERTFLLQYCERLTGSGTENRTDGPVLTDVAVLLSGAASSSADGITGGPHGLRLAAACKPAFDHLSSADLETADDIWSRYGKLSEAELKGLLHEGLCPEWRPGLTAMITDAQILTAGGKTPREVAVFLKALTEADDLQTVQQTLT